MKKIVAVLLVALMAIGLVACAKDNKEAAKPLADPDHVIWAAHGQYQLADGTVNGWGEKDAALYEKSALKAITLDDVKAIDQKVYDALSKKEVKYLYTIDLIFGVNDAGWTTNCMIGGKLNKANGSYAFKVGQCSVETEGDTKVYSTEQWISDPKTAHVENLTPETLFMPVWQEEKDENGFSWADNPVVIGGAGMYTLVIAQYKNASSKDQAGFGAALVQKEKKDGIGYEVVEITAFVPADHSFGIVGSFAGSNWGEGPDIVMNAAGDNTWSGEVELKTGDEFKVRADSDWVNSWGDGDANLKCEADGTYVVTITFEGEVATVKVDAK